MWLPQLLNAMNIKDMKKNGLKLTAEQIYSINKASMKDAVAIFGGGCTAEVISDKGLILTNHHCGYDAIQNHSTVEHDYLADGYWAYKMEDELLNHPGLYATNGGLVGSGNIFILNTTMVDGVPNFEVLSRSGRGYKKKNVHRQSFTQILIEGIAAASAK